jgi:dihydroflavonol-4-reductase
MKAVITGGAGHVGVALARALLTHGHAVRAIVRSEAVGLDGLAVERIPADVGSVESLVPAFKGMDVVFHTAARISIVKGDRDLVESTNVGGTQNVSAACRLAGVKRLVYFSSIEALEPLPLDSPVDETRPFVNHGGGSPYAHSKAHAELALREAMASGLDAVILNPTAIIGPFDFKPSFLGQAVMSFARGRIPMLVDGGFDWVDVRDVAEAAVLAAERAPRGERYIIGGRYASMAELARLVCGEVGVTPPSISCPYGIASAFAPVSTAFCAITRRAPLFTTYSLRVLKGNKRVSHEKAAAELGYRPRDLDQTVRETLAWFRETGRLE